MKTNKLLLAAGTFLTAAAIGLAIPDNFGIIGQNVGQEFEKAIQEPSTWEAGDGLPGKWEKDQLKDDARIFGLLAAGVRMQRVEDKSIDTFQIAYDGDSAKEVRGKSLFDALLLNIKAFSGKEPQRNGQSATFKSEGLVITAEDRGRNAAIVTLKRP
ncbi:MAG: hypothetical protein ACI8UO_002465 [Verrucomicrobiales bacterium]|jgi:hypothetical protein